MADTSRLLHVPSGEVTLAVQERSPAGPGRPTVVLVHGYPDHQSTWDALVARLPLDAWPSVPACASRPLNWRNSASAGLAKANNKASARSTSY